MKSDEGSYRALAQSSRQRVVKNSGEKEKKGRGLASGGSPARRWTRHSRSLGVRVHGDTDGVEAIEEHDAQLGGEERH
jgi:hypothetical protein